MASDAQLKARYDAALELSSHSAAKMVAALREIIFLDAEDTADTHRIKELAIYKMADIFVQQRDADQIGYLLRDIRPYFSSIAKAKTAKIVRTLIDKVAGIPNTAVKQIEIVKESIEWTKAEKRTFLRQRLETRLGSLYLEAKEYAKALQVVTALSREVRRLDDKLLLVDIQLLESKIHFALRNVPKSKASLTAARTNANAIYCPPQTQGQMDLQAGILHAEEKDYKTAYSYFYEAFETYHLLDSDIAFTAIKYMLLTKIMMGKSQDVNSILTGKIALKYVGPELDALRAVAKACVARSLGDFEITRAAFPAALKEDSVVNFHLDALYDTLLQENLARIVEPYSRVEIAHLASMIKLPVDVIERKLSQMILERKLDGILDQGLGHLIVFDSVPAEETYPAALETIQQMGKVVDALYQQARVLG